MAETIQSIFVDPPIAIARLGGSTVPQDAFQWITNPRPRAIAETAVAPDWSLRVLSDGSIEPFMPGELVFRDGPLIRPVCPFFEVWAQIGEANSDSATWRSVRLTPALLELHGVPLGNVTFTIDAQNRKAARRTNNPDLRFGTFPPVVVAANNHAIVQLLAASPPRVAQPMIPRNNSIPIGAFQVMRSIAQPAAGVNWLEQVNIEVLRFRFTPARGHMYGPPSTAEPQRFPGGRGRNATAIPVDGSRAFLNERAGWAGAAVSAGATAIVSPDDTYDGADVGDGLSLGVVDDTCEARIEVSLQFPGARGRLLSATATVFVAPPDFGPDRRPFISLADEINDRSMRGAQRNADMTADELDAWVEDLFERVYETLSLFNLDLSRSSRASRLGGRRLRAEPIPQDGLPRPSFAFGGRDALRSEIPVGRPTEVEPLVLTEHGRTRHRALSNLQSLRNLTALQPGRLRALVRRTFEVERVENFESTTMRMPPLMRNSNALPLTLTSWQYDLLMRWVDDVESGRRAEVISQAPGAVASERAGRAQGRVLNRIRRNPGGP